MSIFCMYRGFMIAKTNDIVEEEFFEDELDEPTPVLALDTVSKEYWKDIKSLANPHLDNQAFARKALKAEKPVHRDAFLYWYQLAPGMQTNRAVSNEFKVSPAAIGLWRKSFNWDVRRDAIRESDLQRIEEAATTTLSAEIMQFISLAKLARSQFAKKIAMGTQEMTVTDVIKLTELEIKLLRELHGEGGSGGDGGLFGRVQGLLGDASEGTRSLLLMVAEKVITNKTPLPHDDLVEANIARQVDGFLEDVEESVTYIEGEYPSD